MFRFRILRPGDATQAQLPMRVRALVLRALMLGALLGFSIAPLASAALQLLVLAAVFWLFERQLPSVRRAAWLGFGLGLGWFLASVSWVYISMHVYGEMPAPMAAVATLALCMVLALFPMAGLALAAFRTPRPVPPLASAARFTAGITVAELARGIVATGFPWAGLGYAQIDGQLSGLATLLGVAGLTMAVCWLAASLVLLPRLLWQDRKKAALLVVIGAGLMVLAGAAEQTSWTEPAGRPLRVRLVQGNVPQQLKFNPERMLQDLRTHADLAYAAPADLVVMPETAIPVPPEHLPAEWLQRTRSYALASNAVVVAGIPRLVNRPEGAQYFNSAMAFDGSADMPPASARSYYDKVHLVPFGEYVPWGFRWFVDWMKIPLGDFGRGGVDQAPLVVRDQRLSINICYEDVFGSELIGRAAAATVMVNLTNLGWFGDSLALPQHLQMARMRAIENGRPMLRATNTGVTAIIDAKGVVLAKLPVQSPGVLAGEVQGMSGTTPYQRLGDWPVWILAASLLAVAFVMERQRVHPVQERGVARMKP